ncbi:MAG: arylamine N-acetyltransferase [Actinomycetota bacterium]
MAPPLRPPLPGDGAVRSLGPVRPRGAGRARGHRRDPRVIGVDAYLDRIDHAGSREPTAETLHDLQVAHMLAVPFENLDVVSDEPIGLERDALFDKIVRRLRAPVPGLRASAGLAVQARAGLLAGHAAGKDHADRRSLDR